jgi:methionine-R-sulfoxide reductase
MPTSDRDESSYSSFFMTRIEHPSSWASRLTLGLGLLIAVGLGIGLLFWSHSREKRILERTQPDILPVPADTQLRRQLTQEQYHVTRENGTETAFRNSHWDNYRPGIYVDIITNEPLFSSTDKFDGGIGWPSFTKPIAPEHVVEKIDHSFGMERTELRAAKSNSHLGHLFKDGPPPTGLRYQVNSAALRFIPAEKLKEEGYAEYISLFRPKA